MTPNTPTLLTLEQASHRAGVSSEWVRRWCERGLGYKTGGRWVVDEERLHRVIEARSTIEQARSVLREEGVA